MSGLPRTAGQSAARVIRQRILTGELAPGAMLNQNELAEEFGMSRIPIRDALRQLSAEGLVQLRAHATASVTPLSIHDLEELYELRLSLEPKLCGIAAPHLTAADIEELGHTLHALETTTDTDNWLRAQQRLPRDPLSPLEPTENHPDHRSDAAKPRSDTPGSTSSSLQIRSRTTTERSTRRPSRVTVGDWNLSWQPTCRTDTRPC